MHWNPAMRLRSLLGPLRIALVVAGLTVVAGAVNQLVAMEPPPGGDGVPAGIAIGFAFVVGTAGLVLVAGGLAIRAPADSPGGSLLRFGRWQHRLVLGGFSLLTGSLLVGFAFLLLANDVTTALSAWLLLGTLGLVAVVAAVCWRLAEGVLALARR